MHDCTPAWLIRKRTIATVILPAVYAFRTEKSHPNIRPASRIAICRYEYRVYTRDNRGVCLIMRIGEAQNVQTSSVALAAGVASLRFPAPLPFFLQPTSVTNGVSCRLIVCGPLITGLREAS